ncbi:MAG: DNA repair protein RadA [Ruminococcaceae bacterium]|nr:DNA repair protein RadA [Oscillospiraceae bacterium]
MELKSKSLFICTECGYRSTKWYGKCPGCDSWNTLEENNFEEEQTTASRKTKPLRLTKDSISSSKLSDINVPDNIRILTKINEFDRVLGGGIVQGSVVLLSGEPGIGKSTMLLQVCASLGHAQKLLYVSGEESQGQIKLRAKRLEIDSDKLYILTETEINDICDEIELLSPDVVIIDSIQTMYDDSSSSAPGTVSQIRNCTQQLIKQAKTNNCAVMIVGHVNKDGAIAGPKILEHMVDTVLYFEGEKQHCYRILRAVKNRFGSTNEIGVFEMQEMGLCEVENPSEMLLSERSNQVSGSCTLCVMEGSRPILAEIQALVSTTAYPAPRRMASGLDHNRVSLITAVLEKRLGLRFSSQDVYINVAGGLRIDEPSSDLAACIALISGIKDIPVPDDIVAIGEIGLSGECRGVGFIENRINEAVRLGFSRILIPHKNYLKLAKNKKFGAEIIPVKSLFDVLKLFV